MRFGFHVVTEPFVGCRSLWLLRESCPKWDCCCLSSLTLPSSCWEGLETGHRWGVAGLYLLGLSILFLLPERIQTSSLPTVLSSLSEPKRVLDVFQLVAHGHVLWDEDLEPVIQNATFAMEDNIWGAPPATF